MTHDATQAASELFATELGAVRRALEGAASRLDEALQACSARPGLRVVARSSDAELMRIIGEWEATTEAQRAFLAKWAPDAAAAR